MIQRSVQTYDSGGNLSDWGGRGNNSVVGKKLNEKGDIELEFEFE